MRTDWRKDGTWGNVRRFMLATYASVACGDVAARVARDVHSFTIDGSSFAGYLDSGISVVNWIEKQFSAGRTAL